METIKIANQDYTIGRLNALDQLHVSRKISPIIPTIIPILTEVSKGGLAELFDSLGEDEDLNLEELKGFNLESLDGLSGALSPFTEALSAMSEEDTNYVITKCLSVVYSNGAALSVKGSIMRDDLGMEQILPLVIAVIRTNLGNFIRGMLTKARSMKSPG